MEKLLSLGLISYNHVIFNDEGEHTRTIAKILIVNWVTGDQETAKILADEMDLNYFYEDNGNLIIEF